MKFDAPKNANYAAQIVRVHTIVDLDGLDFLVAVPVLGHQALTTKGIEAGELRVAFTAETQLSDAYCHYNNLYRHADKNSDESETGYLEDNRRIRAIKLRGHRSNALLMPLDSLSYVGIDPTQLQEGDTFDTFDGQEICRKYEVSRKAQYGPKAGKVERAFKRVDEKLFPEHLETDQYHRNKHLLKPGREVVFTQKLHGTSFRAGNVPVKRKKTWLEKLFNRIYKTPDYEYDVVFGSRKVIKDPNNPAQQHFYDSDIWTEYGKKIAALIPEGFIVYGELLGWTPDGAPLQKNYTYHLPVGEVELYIYRVAHINAQGFLADLSWDGVKDFCRARGLKWVPELFRSIWGDDCYGEDHDVSMFMDQRLHDIHGDWNPDVLPLSDKKTVDEGVCLRQEGLVPTILKAKSPQFLEHETKLLDQDEVDTESAA